MVQIETISELISIKQTREGKKNSISKEDFKEELDKFSKDDFIEHILEEEYSSTENIEDNDEF